MDALETIWAKSRPEIETHWTRCEQGGLPHTAANRDRVIAAFEAFLTTLKGLPAGHSEQPVPDAIRVLYAALDEVNVANGEGLLETDERELLVPIIIEAAVAAGVNSANHDGEPGSEFRNF